MEPRAPLDEHRFPALLEAARSGERAATEALFHDVHPRLLRFLRSAEPRAADDLAGEVWLAVARGLAAFDGGPADFRAWVFAIARRRLADHRRTAARRATTPMEPDELARRVDLLAGSGHRRVDPAEVVERALSAQEAIDLITAVLPPDHAETLLLRIVADLDVTHVAEVMGRSANWVRVTQHRALRKLSAALGNAGGPSDDL